MKRSWKIFFTVMVLETVVLVLILLSSALPDKKEPVQNVENQMFRAVEIPESVDFAGEKMPLERFDIKEALDRELLSNSYFHSQTIRYLKLAPRYFSVVEPILKEHGIPDDFKYLAVAESGFDVRAVSPARAVGFWQFMKGTAQDYGLEINSEIDERYHLEKATHAACEYIKDAYEKFGSYTLVAASYNRGMTGVNKQIVRQKEKDYYNLLLTTETARYVYRITALKLIFENPGKYNFSITEKEKYPIIKTNEIEINGSVVDFADFAKLHGINYKLLKDFNPWLRDTKLTNSKKKKYIIKIPQI